MLLAPTYAEVLERLGHGYRHRYSDQRSRLVGILFARPSSPLAAAEIVPALDDYSYRSADNVDFFLPGYCLGPQADHEFQQVRGSRGEFWVFSPKLFDALRRDVEGLTTWRYSGATDLILANARWDAGEAGAAIDFTTTVACQLDKMKADGAIRSVETCFESIFRFAEQCDGDDPAWGFSDAQGRAMAGSALRRLVLSLLPKKLGDDAERAVHFVARDMRAK